MDTPGVGHNMPPKTLSEDTKITITVGELKQLLESSRDLAKDLKTISSASTDISAAILKTEEDEDNEDYDVFVQLEHQEELREKIADIVQDMQSTQTSAGLSLVSLSTLLVSLVQRAAKK